MSTSSRKNQRNARRRFSQEVSATHSRKLEASRKEDQPTWFGLGMFGLVGWSIAIPTLIGVAIGIWIDSRWPSRFSWTLMLLVAGLALGCLNAWWWIERERREPEEEQGKETHR